MNNTTVSTVDQLARALENLRLAYALALRLDNAVDNPGAVSLLSAELKHLSSDYAVSRFSDPNYTPR